MWFDRALKLANLLVMIFVIVVMSSFLKGCFGGNKKEQQKAPTVTQTIDTNMLKEIIVRTIRANPIFTGSTFTRAAVHEKETIYKIDTTATKQFVVEQYAKLVEAFLTSNYFIDTMRLGNLGYVWRNDTIQKNMMSGSSFGYNIKPLEIIKTVTITKTPERKNKIFIYGGVEANKKQPLKGLGLRAGLMFQNKNDHAVSLGLSQWPGYNNQFDLNYYWKIHFRKRK